MAVFEIGAVTDEFSPDSLDRALDAMAALGMTFVELRVVDGRNIIEHTDDEVDDLRRRVEAQGMRVVSIASPVLKCGLPDAPPIAPHIQQDMFSSAFGFDDQPRLASRAFEIAERTGARIVRVFSYWRTVDPDALLRSCCCRRCAGSRSRRRTAVSSSASKTSTRATSQPVPKQRGFSRPSSIPRCRSSGIRRTPWLRARRHFQTATDWLPYLRIAHVHAKDCDCARSCAGVRPAGRNGGGLARAARGACARWLPRNDQSRDSLERSEWRQVRREASSADGTSRRSSMTSSGI